MINVYIRKIQISLIRAQFNLLCQVSYFPAKIENLKAVNNVSVHSLV